MILEGDIVICLMEFLDHGEARLRKEACWIISNIAIDSMEALSLILAHKVLLPRLSRMIMTDSDVDVRSEALIAVANILITGLDDIKILVAVNRYVHYSEGEMLEEMMELTKDIGLREKLSEVAEKVGLGLLTNEDIFLVRED
ncbi:MAG: hypothetical protein EOO43_05095 [Flavobacterium sp.]|nr:MAG: hypothetical protein EOO43_05095 [Flavobacterium sp.]